MSSSAFNVPNEFSSCNECFTSNVSKKFVENRIGATYKILEVIK
jgi:hypothetical protein